MNVELWYLEESRLFFCTKKAAQCGFGILLLCCMLTGCGKETVSLTEPADPETEITEITTTAAAEKEPSYLCYVKNLDGNGKLIASVPHFTQTETYLTACESLAAVSMLRYYGVSITPEEFIEQYLPVTDYPMWSPEDNLLHGEHPQKYFLGDPMAADGYGCYNGPIAAGVNKIADGLAIEMNGTSLKNLCERYIDIGQPVLIWASLNMDPVTPGHSWLLPDGEEFTFLCPEHALVLIGYDDACYYFSDSMKEAPIVSYPKEQVETAYLAFGRMAVIFDPARLKDVPEGMRAEHPAQVMYGDYEYEPEIPEIEVIPVPEETEPAPVQVIPETEFPPAPATEPQPEVPPIPEEPPVPEEAAETTVPVITEDHEPELP